MTKIKVLDSEVVKRIAAGETLQRPVNAVKELIENSLDAGANRICVHVQVPAASSSAETSAGLFSIQVTDNGSGISKEDLALLCERHATSKLVSVGDLRSVGTFGFRGEALASCSQVARVEVVTRSREDGEEVAWRASYVAGKMTGEATPLAGNFGTIINVKDLFYGNRVRREALLNSSDEFQRIFQVIQAYALNQAGKCAFTLSKRRDRMEIQTSLSDGVVAVVKNLWGEELGGALLPFEIEVDAGLGIEEGSGGWATRTTFHKLKSPQVIIFLNGRLIEHSVLRRSMLQAFAMHLPTSPPAHPFIYLELRVKGSRVDVNVHPAKKQVYFVDEGEIVGRVLEGLEKGLLRRQYETQNLKPIVIESKRIKTAIMSDNVSDSVSVNDRSNSSSNSKSCFTANDNVKSTTAPSATTAGVTKISNLYPSQRVLTDNRNHRIDTFLYRSQVESGGLGGGGWSPVGRAVRKGGERDENLMSVINTSVSSPLINTSVSSPLINTSVSSNVIKEELTSSPLIAAAEGVKSQEMSIILDSQTSITNSTSTPVINNSVINKESLVLNSSVSPLANSVSNYYQKLLSRANDQLGKLLKDSLVVGLIDSKWSLLQSGTNLLLCDMERLNYELFYSLIAGKEMEERMFVVEEGGVRVKSVFEEEEVGREAEEVLRGEVEFLRKEFGIKFEDNGGLILTGLPVIITGQRCPSTKHLSTFIQRLCLVPDYNNPAIKGLQVLEELAMVYGLVDAEGWPDWEEYVKHVVLPAYRDPRARYTLHDEFRIKEEGMDDGEGGLSVVPPLQIITNTETLYKSFERC